MREFVTVRCTPRPYRADAETDRLRRQTGAPPQHCGQSAAAWSTA